MLRYNQSTYGATEDVLNNYWHWCWYVIWCTSSGCACVRVGAETSLTSPVQLQTCRRSSSWAWCRMQLVWSSNFASGHKSPSILTNCKKLWVNVYFYSSGPSIFINCVGALSLITVITCDPWGKNALEQRPLKEDLPETRKGQERERSTINTSLTPRTLQLQQS